MSEGILFLRLVLGLVLLAHAGQKTFGWFQGRGLSTMAEAFSSLGLQPGRVFVIVASVTEVLAAVSLLLGLLVPLGAAAATGAMLVAGLPPGHIRKPCGRIARCDSRRSRSLPLCHGHSALTSPRRTLTRNFFSEHSPSGRRIAVLTRRCSSG